jgi:hypothetical protein
MEFTRIKAVVAAPEPETRYSTPTAEEIAAGGPLDPEGGRTLAPGESWAKPVEARGGSYPARFEGLVQFTVEPCDAGRCAQCRDNARKRFTVRATDQHGMRKWCPGCLRDKYGIAV